MLAAQKYERLQELRELPQPRSIILEEELAALVRELQTAEAECLSEATQRLRRERENADARNRSLERLEARRIALLARLQDALSEARTERQAIDGELASVMSGISEAVG